MEIECKTPRRSARLGARGLLTESTTPNTGLNKSMKTPTSALYKLVSPLFLTKKRLTKTTPRAPANSEKQNKNIYFESKIPTPKTTTKSEKSIDINAISPSIVSKQLELNDEESQVTEQKPNKNVSNDCVTEQININNPEITIPTPKTTTKSEKSIDINAISPSIVSKQLELNNEESQVTEQKPDKNVSNDCVTEQININNPEITINENECNASDNIEEKNFISSPRIVKKDLSPTTTSKTLDNVENKEVYSSPNIINVSPMCITISPKTTDEKQDEDNDLNSTFVLTNENIEADSNKNKNESIVESNNLTVPLPLEQKKESILAGIADNVTLRNNRNKLKKTKFNTRGTTITPLKKIIQTPDIFKRSSSKKFGTESKLFKNISHIKEELSATNLEIRSIRKRSLSVTDTDTIKKNNRVKFFSPLNSEIQIDVIDKKMKFNNTPNSNLNRSENYTAKKRERTQSNIETKTDLNMSLKFPFSPANRKVPNFAAIHNKEFNKMESILEHSQRKNERAKALFARKNTENQLSSLDTSKMSVSVKDLKTSKTDKHNANKVIKRNQRNVKLYKNRPNIEECIKTQIKEKQTDILRCVRTNRRFDLLMEFRKSKENK